MTFSAELAMSVWVRLRDGALHRAKIQSSNRLRDLEKQNGITFLIAHHNSVQFLEMCLHAIRRHHANSRVIVADSGSALAQYLGAKRTCLTYGAELQPHVFRHGHTTQLNTLCRSAHSDAAVFLDQDCILLAPITPLLSYLDDGALLIGPRDEMWLEHPNLLDRYPQLANSRLREAPEYVHASLMMTRPRELLRYFGREPFRCARNDFELAPHQMEHYYGLCNNLRRTEHGSVQYLGSKHSAYGVGMYYEHEGKRIAYHNWYSGRVYKVRGKIDVVLDTDWLKKEANRFMADYWNDCLQ